jgi:hypothetical protein
MKYLKRPLQEWVDYGYNPIHLFKDYYLIRLRSKNYCKFSFYTIAKIRKEL